MKILWTKSNAFLDVGQLEAQDPKHLNNNERERGSAAD
jgi:hypothetical protein